MSHRSLTFQRFVSAFVAFSLACLAALAGPATSTQARQQETTLFSSSFDELSLGPVSAPVPVSVGAVTASEGTVAVAEVGGGQALTVDGTSGQATALLQFSNYPGALPTKEKGAVQLRIEAEFTLPVSGTTSVTPSEPVTSTPPLTSTPTLTNTGSTSFGLFAGAAFYELISFGPNGALTRDGEALGLIAAPGSKVKIEARVKVGPGRQTVWMSIQTSSGKKILELTLDGGFTRENINQLRFQAAAGSSTVALEKLRVRLLPNERDPEPPAVIEVGDKDIEQEVEVINGIVFLNVQITIVNKGGAAKESFLVLNLDDFDDLFDLDNLSFLEGIGYVAKVDGKIMYIGLGKNNLLDGKVKLKIKFKAKQNRLDIKLNTKLNINFEDVDGFRSVAVPVVVVVAQPVVVQPVVVQPLPISEIDDRFEDVWEDRGGLVIFGLPLTQPMTMTNGIIVQYFERARLELHPDLIGTPYYIQLGLIAVELGYTRVPTTTTAPTDTAELVWYFQPTGHLIAKPFRNFWKNRGGLAIYGLPISGVIIEDGRQVQYFERARLELHPEAAGTAYEVQIGRLGVELLSRR